MASKSHGYTQARTSDAESGPIATMHTSTPVVGYTGIVRRRWMRSRSLKSLDDDDSTHTKSVFGRSLFFVGDSHSNSLNKSINIVFTPSSSSPSSAPLIVALCALFVEDNSDESMIAARTPSRSGTTRESGRRQGGLSVLGSIVVTPHIGGDEAEVSASEMCVKSGLESRERVMATTTAIVCCCTSRFTCQLGLILGRVLNERQ